MYLYLSMNLNHMEKISKELIGASTIPIILSILSKKESYGYEIIKNVKDISDGKLAFKDGTLYPVLHKLEKRELIESYWKIAESGKKGNIIKSARKERKNFHQKRKIGK